MKVKAGVCTAETMMDLIESLVKARGIAAVISTHDPLMVARAHNVVELHDGRLVQPVARQGRHAAPAVVSDPVA